jgi:regulator of replication initiation timing
MQMMSDQISFLHNELNQLKSTSYQVLRDNEHLKQENQHLQEKKIYTTHGGDSSMIGM